MITVTEKTNGVSHYIFDDDVILTPDELGIDTSVGFRIGHLNETTAAIYTNVTPPEDWAAEKYFFDGENWSIVEASPYIVEPSAEM